MIDSSKLEFCRHQKQNLKSLILTNEDSNSTRLSRTNVKSNLEQGKKENEEKTDSEFCKYHTALNFKNSDTGSLIKIK